MLSFVVPAHNEEALLGRTLAGITASAPAAGEPFEVVVVDDSSTDATADVARARGARVVPVAFRHIAATRNAGARAARGDVLFFVDADTVPTPAAVRAAVAALRRGAVGGACMFRYDVPMPAWAKVMYPVGIALGRAFKVVGGCFLFCTRAAFDASGGFPEEFFAAEELGFTRALKRVGRFVIPRPLVITSGRKLKQVSAGTLLNLLVRVALRPADFRRREGLDLWYGPRPPDPVPLEVALPR
jgi:glycosyltransferase involved in cell wall biosynthesis